MAQYSEGVRYVIVNGQVVLDDGEVHERQTGAAHTTPGITFCDRGHVMIIRALSVRLAALLLIAAAPTQAQVANARELTGTARSRDGMVVTGSAYASEAAARVLGAGGNAVDAAVTAAFVLGVVEPSMSGIGGRTQILLRTRTGEFVGIDGTTQVPASYPGGAGSRGESTYGYESIAIPGTVAALVSAARRYGSWPLERVLEPAIQLAENGFAIPPPEADRIAGIAAQLREFEGTRHYFLKPDGSPFRAGEPFRQPDLARTLRRIAARGAAGFYLGETAEAIARDHKAHGGFITAADLQRYGIQDALIVRGSYRDHTLIGTYLPASGATTIEAMQILQHFDVPAFAGSARWASIVAQSLLLSFDDRDSTMEPASRKAAWLTSKELAALRARAIADRGARIGDRGLHSPDDEPEHTTHLSVVDRNGMVVTLTQSVGPLMGSRVAAPGLGFLYAATMGYLGTTRPGDRPFSSQSPLIVMEGNQPVYVLGAAGARRILSAIVQTLSRAIDQKLPLYQAMALPRFHPTASQIEIEVRSGTAWSTSALDSIRQMGFTVRPRDDAPYFARINGIGYDLLAGEWIGVADSRWQGAASGPIR
ncbi:MAG: gamma-glutamyltransferase [Gemmatimonadota bacterium]